MQCWSRRNRGGIIGHILRQYPLCRSCSICPLQCLNLFHKLLNQHTLRIRLQHRKEKQQGRGGGGVLPTFQVAICAAGNAKLLCHGFLRQRLLLPQGIQFLGEKLPIHILKDIGFSVDLSYKLIENLDLLLSTSIFVFNCLVDCNFFHKSIE